MQTYGIDGALVQRFINSIPRSKKEGDVVLKNVRAAAENHNRVFAVENWYLRIAQEISRMFHGEIKPTSKLPLKPSDVGK
jgi:hypothetical protein